MKYLLEFTLLWLYYAKFFILGSIIITFLLNKITRKLYIPPLIINMVSVIALFFSNIETRTEAMYIYYMPTVITSILMNLLIYLYRLYNSK